MYIGSCTAEFRLNHVCSVSDSSLSPSASGFVLPQKIKFLFEKWNISCSKEYLIKFREREALARYIPLSLSDPFQSGHTPAFQGTWALWHGHVCMNNKGWHLHFSPYVISVCLPVPFSKLKAVPYSAKRTWSFTLDNVKVVRPSVSQSYLVMFQPDFLGIQTCLRYRQADSRVSV